MPRKTDLRSVVRRTSSDRHALGLVLGALRATNDPGMWDEADALAIAFANWSADSPEEFGVASKRELILASLDLLSEYGRRDPA
jgi:hypothetical protein